MSLSPKETDTPCSPYCLLPPPSLSQHKCLCSKLIQLKANPSLPAPPPGWFNPQPGSPHNHTSICLHKGGSSRAGWKQTGPCFPMVELVYASCMPRQSKSRLKAGVLQHQPHRPRPMVCHSSPSFLGSHPFAHTATERYATAR